mmetsp:Transcript_56278/g.131863  ORF Transcript_56278/g.131863 Transcript_56278/m.131863 type:complete len:211 (+) Transcript_56278:1673-2305(+)
MSIHLLKDLEPFFCWRHLQAYTALNVNSARLWSRLLHVNIFILLIILVHGLTHNVYTVLLLIVVIPVQQHVLQIHANFVLCHIVRELLLLQLREVIHVEGTAGILVLFVRRFVSLTLMTSQVLELASLRPAALRVVPYPHRKAKYPVLDAFDVHLNFLRGLEVKCIIFAILFSAFSIFFLVLFATLLIFVSKICRGHRAAQEWICCTRLK